MAFRVRRFFDRHPVLRETLIWAAPAICFGLALRLLLLSYLPYAYWGSDSKSYFSFAYQLLSTGDVSLVNLDSQDLSIRVFGFIRAVVRVPSTFARFLPVAALGGRVIDS